MRVDLPLDKKTVKNQDWVTGLPGSRAAEPPGRGPSRAMGRRPLGHGPLGHGPLGHGPAFSKTQTQGPYSVHYKGN